MSKKKVRLPRFFVPKPTRPHGSRKGERGYDRKENKRLERQAVKGRYDSD